MIEATKEEQLGLKLQQENFSRLSGGLSPLTVVAGGRRGGPAFFPSAGEGGGDGGDGGGDGGAGGESVSCDELVCEEAEALPPEPSMDMDMCEELCEQEAPMEEEKCDMKEKEEEFRKKDKKEAPEKRKRMAKKKLCKEFEEKPAAFRRLSRRRVSPPSPPSPPSPLRSSESSEEPEPILPFPPSIDLEKEREFEEARKLDAEEDERLRHQQMEQSESMDVEVEDLTEVPGQLDKKYEELDEDSALRPTIINPGKTWTKQSQKTLVQSNK